MLKFSEVIELLLFKNFMRKGIFALKMGLFYIEFHIRVNEQ